MSETASRHLLALDVPPGVDGVKLVHRAVRSALRGSGPAVALLPHDDASQHVARQRAALSGGSSLVDDRAAVVVTTSGSSGDPIGVVLGDRALRAAAAATHAVFARGPGRWLVAMPVTAVGGLMTLVRAIDADIEPVAWQGIGGAEPFTATSFARDARETLARCDRDAVPSYVSLVPTQLTRVLRSGPETTELLARFDHVLIGAAALPEPLRRTASAAGITLTSTYGASETCGGVVYDGVPLPGVDVDIDGATEGPIVIGGDTIALGYLDRPELTAATFPDDRFHTTDVGYIVDGKLTVLGRSDDVIKVGGSKVSLLAMTEAVRAVDGVDEAAVVAVDDSEWGQRPVVFVAGRADEPAIRDALDAAVGRSQFTVRRLDSLPYLPNGKIDRMSLQRHADGA